MTETLQRLQRLVGDLPSLHNGGERLNRPLVEKAPDKFKKLVSAHLLLQVEYSALCVDLERFIAEKRTLVSLVEYKLFREKLYSALVLAEILEHLYKHYLAVSREVTNLQNHQKLYRNLLGLNAASKEKIAPFSLSKQVRAKTAYFNWHRLFLVRARRVFITITPFLQQTFYPSAIKSIEKYIAPFFNYLAWVFFIPRLAINSFMLLKHSIPNFAMETGEYELAWYVRLIEQLKRRWHEFANDSVWLVSGVLGCFVLTGSLATAGMYLTIALFFYDILVAGLRAYIDISRLNELEREYDGLLDTSDPGSEKFKQAIQDRISLDKKRLILSVINTSALFLGMCFSIPALVALSPIFPLISAVIILAVTVAVYYANTQLKDLPEIKPKEAKALLANSFFKPPTDLGIPLDNFEPKFPNKNRIKIEA